MDNDILRIAREAGFNTEHAATNEYLRRFAELVREDAQRKTIRVLEELHGEAKNQHNYYLHAIVQIQSRN